MRCSFVEQNQDTPPHTLLPVTPEVVAPPQHDSVVSQAPESLQNFPTPTSMPEFNSTAASHFTNRSFGLLELELIHHYSTQTYLTITSRLTSHIIWRDVIFREALRYPFLLDALMATSALHKATCQPETSEAHAEYSRRALGYQNAALAGYIPALSNPTKSNSIALFAISVLLSVWSFGSKRLPEALSNGRLGLSPSLKMRHSTDGPSSSDDTIDFSSVISLMQVIQGVHAVLMQTREWLVEELMELLLSPKDEDLPQNTPDVEAALSLLAERIDQACGSMANKSDAVKEIHDLYLERLQSLRVVARCRTVLEWDPYVFSWPVTVKPLYMDLLRQHDPIALALFIHWAACFRALDHLWWAKGWAYSLVQDVSAFLDHSWTNVLVWPRQAVGLGYKNSSSRVKPEGGD